MSSIFVEVGQCGCQIGHKLNKKLSTSYYSTRTYPPNKVHAIMIDTEPKVLKPFIDNPPKWLDAGNVKYFQHGRGNNWSYGFMHELPQGKMDTQFVAGHRQFSHLTKKEKEERQAKHRGQSCEQAERNKSKSPISKHKSIQDRVGHSPTSTPKKQADFSVSRVVHKKEANIEQYPSLTQFEQKVLIGKYFKQNKEICEFTLEKIRKELDSMDCPHAINVICSLGGGTGSGLGTKIIEKVYDQFNMNVYPHVILPNKSGETPLQIYNCTLSLSSIQEHSTAIFTYENDNMINTFLQQKQQSKGEFKGSDLDFINQQISDMQSRLIKVNQLQNYGRFYGHIVDECVFSNEMKYVGLFGAGLPTKPNNDNPTDGFDGLFEKMCHQLRVYNEQVYQIEGVTTKREKCLANSMLVMSSPTNSQQNFQLQEHHQKKLRSIINPVSYNSQLNIEYAGLKKQSQSSNLGMSKMTTTSAVGQSQGVQSNQCDMLLVMNHSNIVRYLEYLSVAGRRKYEAKAYLWHYKYADLEAAFNNIESVIDQYEQAANQ